MQNEQIEKSRTQIKKEYRELQNLGIELSNLPLYQLKQLDLPEELMEALEEGTKIKSKPAAQRHRNHIGSLMKNVDPEPIRKALQQLSDGKPVESENDIARREWIDKFLTGSSDAIEEFLTAFPHIERQTIRQLVKNTIKEKDAGKVGKERRSLKSLKKLINRCLNNSN